MKLLDQFVQHTMEQLKYWLAPSWCAFCRQLLVTRNYFCTRCTQRIQPVVSSSIEINTHYSMKVIASCAYKEPVKSLIVAKHYSQILASYQLGQILWDHSIVQHLPFDYIIPIPLHWTRYAVRGYNQAEIIAAHIADKSGKPMVKLLKRSKRTKLQASLSVEQREENVKNVFRLTNNDVQNYQGKHLLIVDDLMTTGSTLQQAAKTLTRLKPASITAAVVCRVT